MESRSYSNADTDAIPCSNELRDTYLQSINTLVIGTIGGRLYFRHLGRLYSAQPLTQEDIRAMFESTAAKVAALQHRIEPWMKALVFALIGIGLFAVAVRIGTAVGRMLQ